MSAPLHEIPTGWCLGARTNAWFGIPTSHQHRNMRIEVGCIFLIFILQNSIGNLQRSIYPAPSGRQMLCGETCGQRLPLLHHQHRNTPWRPSANHIEACTRQFCLACLLQTEQPGAPSQFVFEAVGRPFVPSNSQSQPCNNGDRLALSIQHQHQ